MSYPSNNNSNINSELFAPLVVQAEYAAYENSIARQMVRVYDVPMNSGKVVQVPLWAAISAELITDERAATAKTTNTTAPTITLAEHVVYNQVTDMLRDSAYNDVMAQLGDQSGRAIAESIDAQVFAEFANFSSDLGSTSTELTVNLILKAAATLRGRKLTGPFIAVVHPAQAYNIKKQLTYSAQTNVPQLSDIGNSVLGGFYIGQIGGCSIYESSLITADTTGGATAHKAGVFAANALGHAMRGGIDMNTLYLPAARATDVVLKAVAGATTLNADWGITITADSIVN
jgi:N4-gp56 family major capsid protein